MDQRGAAFALGAEYAPASGRDARRHFLDPERAAGAIDNAGPQGDDAAVRRRFAPGADKAVSHCALARRIAAERRFGRRSSSDPALRAP